MRRLVASKCIFLGELPRFLQGSFKGVTQISISHERAALDKGLEDKRR